jgi:AcrR family transcriptional regulator
MWRRRLLKKKSMGLRRNLKEEHRREEMISSAIKVFSVKGYAHSTMYDLAADTGYSKALIYWYWDNKAALFNELIDRCMVPYCELLKSVLESTDPYNDKFFRFLGEFAELFKRQNSLNRLVHFGSLHDNREKPLENFRERVNSYYNQVIQYIEALLQQGKDAGYLKAELDTSSLAFFMLLSVEGYIYMTLLEERRPMEQVLIENLVKYFIPGLVNTEHANTGKKIKPPGKKL